MVFGAQTTQITKLVASYRFIIDDNAINRKFTKNMLFPSLSSFLAFSLFLSVDSEMMTMKYNENKQKREEFFFCYHRAKWF